MSVSAGVKPGRVLALCLAAHAFLAIDRGLMGVLQEAIKRDLLLSDSQLAMISGLSFGIFFALASLPIGWLVDHFNRRNILAISVLIFSGITALGAGASSFGQLFLMRSVVGVGEAGGIPAATSLLADLYPPSRRASVFSIFYIGTPLGLVIAFFVGGWFATHFGWRGVLLLAGLPGMMLAVALRFLIKEPVRTIAPGTADQALSLSATLAFILGKRSLRHLLISPVVTSAGSAGLIGFAASFFVRIHGLDLAQAGLVLGTFYGIVGMIGSFGGGWLVDRLVVRDPRWPTWWCALAYVIAAPAAALMLLSPSLIGAIAGLSIVALVTNATYGTASAVLQSLVTARMRGSIMGVFALMSYFFGSALGPMIVGGMSDFLNPYFAVAALRWAMLSAIVLYLWGALHFALASRHIFAELIPEPDN